MTGPEQWKERNEAGTIFITTKVYSGCSIVGRCSLPQGHSEPVQRADTLWMGWPVDLYARP